MIIQACCHVFNNDVLCSIFQRKNLNITELKILVNKYCQPNNREIYLNISEQLLFYDNFLLL